MNSLPDNSKPHIHKNLVLRLPLLPYKSTYTPEEMQRLLEDPGIEEAFHMASPNLLDEYKRFKTGAISDPQEIEKLWIALHNYFTRMSTRATPFGLFAGTTIGSWAEDTALTVDQNQPREKQARFDMEFVEIVIDLLEAQDEIRTQLRYAVNASIYRVGENINYIDYEKEKTRRVFKTSQIEANPYLDLVIEYSQQPVPYGLLVDKLLAADDSLEKEEVQEFLDELINEHLIFSELQPAMIGSLPWNNILKALASLDLKEPESLRLRDQLEALNTEVAQLSGENAVATAFYKALSTKAREVSEKAKPNRLIQVDSFLASEPYTLNRDVQIQLQEAGDVLRYFTQTTKNNTLIEFTKAFQQRYGNQEVALLEALDPNVGIGYPAQKPKDYAPFLKDIKAWGTTGSSKGQASKNLLWNKAQEFLLKEVMATRHEAEPIIDLSEAEFDWSPNLEQPMADTSQVVFNINGYDTEQQRYLLELSTYGNTSGTNLISRFAFSHELTNDLLQDLVKTEQELKPDGLVAEISHLEQSRLGNVTLRPSMRDYEIRFLANSHAAPENQLPLSDLSIQVNEANGEIRVYSRRLKKRVYPKLSNAHNYTGSDQPPYRFLSELQGQGVQLTIAFRWYSLGSMFKNLPRVVYKGVVLSKAEWNLDHADCKEIFEGNIGENWKSWCSKWKLPERFLFSQFDNNLLVDGTSEISIKAFVAEAKKQSKIRLTEFLFDPDTCPVKGQDGAPFVNQFVSFLEQPKPQKTTEAAKVEKPETKTAGPVTVQEVFPVGTEWLYFKIYCSPNQADEILLKAIAPIRHALLSKKHIDKWFFIRYSDPDFHLRVRLHFPSQQALGEALPFIHRMLEPLRKSQLVLNVVMDTYERELERYWGDSITDCEDLFYHDSEGVLGLIQTIANTDNEALRWQFAGKMMTRYLSLSRHQSISDKVAFAKKNLEFFGREFGINKKLKRQLDTKYRNLKQGFESMHKSDWQQEADAILASFSRLAKPVLDKVIADNEGIKNEIDLSFLISSLVHMNMNRIWPVKGRFHEFVMYYLMHKDYKSLEARAQYDKTFELA